MKMCRLAILSTFLLLAACGMEAKRRALSSPSAPLPKPSAKNPQPLSGAGIYTLSYIEPAATSQKWQRKFQLHIEEAARAVVEKYEDGAWHPFSFADESGVFVDKDASTSARYRIAKKYETETLEGAVDFVLSNEALANLKEESLNAFRIILPRGQSLCLGTRNLILRASHSIVLDGEILAFPKDAPHGGLSSGSLYMEAPRVSGQGRIALHGQQGAAGRKGAPGQDAFESEGDISRGKNGERGGAGGRGGNVEIHCTVLCEIHRGQISSQGGRGAAGGAGGEGGVLAWATLEETYKRLPAVRSTAGSKGADGVSGASGSISIFDSRHAEAAPEAQDFRNIAEVAHLPSATNGWLRRLQVKLAQTSRWPVEKSRAGGAWEPAGFTDENGLYFDHDILEPLRYRVGFHYISPEYSAFKSVDLTDLLGSELKDSQRVKAARVVLRRGEELRLRTFDLSIEAEEIEIEGRIVSFAPSEDSALASGSLHLKAVRILGDGEIHLNGAMAPAAPPGERGADFYRDIPGPHPLASQGAKGHDGAPGGRGGDILIHYREELLLDPTKISNMGAEGGAGGAGGAGGLDLSHFQNNLGPGRTHWLYAPAGAAGNPGSRGASGLKVIRKTKT
jgi:hypothetical protein